MKKLDFEFCAVPVEILERTDLTLAEKLLYSVLLGFQSNGDSWASNEYLASKMGCNICTIKRSLNTLESKNFIRRDTQQVDKFKRERTIKTLDPTGQILPFEGAKCASVGAKRTSHEGQNAPRTEGQNASILDNSLIDNRIDKPDSIESIKTPPAVLKLLKKGKSIGEMLKTATVIVDDNGVERVQLENGKIQNPRFQNLFFHKGEPTKLKERYEVEFGDRGRFYLSYACNLLNNWIEENKAKALKRQDHYKQLLGWPLDQAKKAHLDELRLFNAEQQKERYAR